jgi:hypothetical protein
MGKPQAEAEHGRGNQKPNDRASATGIRLDRLGLT